MKRVMLKVAYDGTNYHGWQIQPNVVTIESVLNEVLSELFQEEIKVIGASRTDTGVHSLGNIAVFDTSARIPADKISYALNQRLRRISGYNCPKRLHLIFIRDIKTAKKHMCIKS